MLYPDSEIKNRTSNSHHAHEDIEEHHIIHIRSREKSNESIQNIVVKVKPAIPFISPCVPRKNGITSPAANTCPRSAKIVASILSWGFVNKGAGSRKTILDRNDIGLFILTGFLQNACFSSVKR